MKWQGVEASLESVKQQFADVPSRCHRRVLLTVPACGDTNIHRRQPTFRPALVSASKEETIDGSCTQGPALVIALLLIPLALYAHDRLWDVELEHPPSCPTPSSL